MTARIHLLGPLSAVTADGTAIRLGGPKPRTLLAALLLARDSVLPDTHLARLLWAGTAPATAEAQLYTYASRLRKALAPHVRLRRHRPGYQLRSEAHLDTDEFTRLVHQGHRLLAAGDPETALRHADAALALWRGPALADVAEPLRAAESPRFDELRMSALETRIEACLTLHPPARLLPELTALVARHPMRERFRAQLMVALYRDQRQTEALQVYHRGRALLDDHVGVAPGPLLRQTYQHILTGHILTGTAPDTTATGSPRRAAPGTAAATAWPTGRPSSGATRD
ncbi:AfsR/SARP family transcriptional regulator [Actinokineospora sp. NBRC 105648]|uniref:AfsR/SARP family transcriptional regulator n=1 Tax=Actinokineospora sp. NBRC 105648 TaxID=3032206 RepID=UPI0024A59BD4|nr:AfsR/SARP family transcriptional regulator [Actinokineospora sp. NBRC 105648]GLZ37036.1 SARP family transcriptional regulator [Actinokineospora sp. NBRC 105648]